MSNERLDNVIEKLAQAHAAARERRNKAQADCDQAEYQEAHGEATGLAMALAVLRRARSEAE